MLVAKKREEESNDLTVFDMGLHSLYLIEKKRSKTKTFTLWIHFSNLKIEMVLFVSFYFSQRKENPLHDCFMPKMGRIIFSMQGNCT